MFSRTLQFPFVTFHFVKYNPGYCNTPGAPPTPPNRVCMFHCTGPLGSYDDGWFSFTFYTQFSDILREHLIIFVRRCGGAQIAGQNCEYPINHQLACFRPGSVLNYIPYETFYTCDFDACQNYINTAPLYAGVDRAQGSCFFSSFASAHTKVIDVLFNAQAGLMHTHKSTGRM